MLKDYCDYIEFGNNKQNINELYLMYESCYILFRSNDISYINQVYDYQHISYVKDVNIPICGSITVIIDKNMFPVRYDYDTYDENKPVKKTHPMYIEGVTNGFYEYGNKIVHIYHYPNESINMFDKKHEEYFTLVSNIKDAIKFSLNGIKMIISSVNLRNCVYSLHSSAVVYNGKGYAFLGGSHSGKTSIYVNLLCKGFGPINDDLVFWHFTDNSIVLKRLPTRCRLRDQSTSKIIMSNDYTKFGNDIRNNHCSVDLDIYNKDIELDAIFIPEFGFERTSISRIFGKDILKKIARACTSFGFLEITDDFHKSFNELLKCDFYSLKMSNDYNDVCDQIIKVIKERI